ncbi:TetR/AcrR family transcriptional regulator [Streptomyces zagrosensis]|uniref:AcrR family transcriptional regulator n=1 Tax=Streptomyces zagrosensis TaxID=1042984 RepID=A0A7W9QBQ0_9ACTN|nr:TetR/AcrR family transcriptional regulator [Streptomyces zagrosensis]MBB5937176.1 AcrR family transcriptional regulator [Streptomyces zagrosensis]
MTDRPYHHGNLRSALLTAAATAITEKGPAALSLRDLARRAGVSHAAPTHHFGDKTGLLTALAAEGYTLLADALGGAGDDLLESGVAYVRFAIEHRAHFEVMFQPGLYHRDDPQVAAARDRAGRSLTIALSARPGQPPGQDSETAELAAWSMAHGFAALWLSGALPTAPDLDPEPLAKNVLGQLFDQP